MRRDLREREGRSSAHDHQRAVPTMAATRAPVMIADERVANVHAEVAAIRTYGPTEIGRCIDQFGPCACIFVCA